MAPPFLLKAPFLLVTGHYSSLLCQAPLFLAGTIFWEHFCPMHNVKCIVNFETKCIQISVKGCIRGTENSFQPLDPFN